MLDALLVAAEWFCKVREATRPTKKCVEVWAVAAAVVVQARLAFGLSFVFRLELEDSAKFVRPKSLHGLALFASLAAAVIFPSVAMLVICGARNRKYCLARAWLMIAPATELPSAALVYLVCKLHSETALGDAAACVLLHGDVPQAWLAMWKLAGRVEDSVKKVKADTISEKGDFDVVHECAIIIALARNASCSADHTFTARWRLEGDKTSAGGHHYVLRPIEHFSEVPPEERLAVMATAWLQVAYLCGMFPACWIQIRRFFVKRRSRRWQRRERVGKMTADSRFMESRLTKEDIWSTYATSSSSSDGECTSCDRRQNGLYRRGRGLNAGRQTVPITHKTL